MSKLEVTETPKRGRRQKARHRDVIIGCIEERLSIIEATTRAGGVGVAGSSVIDDHIKRLNDLFGELKRSVNGKDADEE